MKIIILTIAVLTFSGCDDLSFAYSDEQLAMAIYHAEGGDSAQYPFGIRSVSCDTYANCKRICKTTIRNNRQRFAQVRNKGHQSYLDFLASRFAPCRGRISAQERRLNCYWLKNVKDYLKRHYHERA